MTQSKIFSTIQETLLYKYTILTNKTFSYRFKMTFPVLPLIQDTSDKNAILEYAITGHVLLPFEKFPTRKHILQEFPYGIKVLLDGRKSSLTIEGIIEALNTGVYQIFIDESDVEEFIIKYGLPSHRFAIQVKESRILEPLKLTTSAVIVQSILTKESIIELSDNGKRTLFYDGEVTQEEANSLAQAGIIPIISTKLLTKKPSEKDAISISSIFTSTLTTDRLDGLFTTLVCGPPPTYTALGVVYSSIESIQASVYEGGGIYQSRKRKDELWYKGKTSGATQKLVKLEKDCDSDVVKFVVEQKKGTGFCHLEGNYTCFHDQELFGEDPTSGSGLYKLDLTLQNRKESAPDGSYTKRLFSDELLIISKLKEELDELIEAGKEKNSAEIAWECADLFYFAMVWCVKNGVNLADVEKNLDIKSFKVTRRKGDAKPAYEEKRKEETTSNSYQLKIIDTTLGENKEEVSRSLERPVQKTADIMKLVLPIISKVKTDGDKALLELTDKFDGVKLSSPILTAPFPEEYMKISDDMKAAIDLSIANIEKFHSAQLPKEEVMTIETSPGVYCSRFAKPIENVGLYVPGGTAVLPSTAMMLGVPAKVAGCSNIIIASPPSRATGRVTPEVVYVAHKLGAKSILMAGGAQAVGALAYGTESVLKCDKILGPGNQFVTAAKMHVQNDTQALCSIDMPAGPSEVLVIADEDADEDFVASDLLSQAEHGIDSQVILIGVGLTKGKLKLFQDAVTRQAEVLPRNEIVSKCLSHSYILLVNNYEEAFALSNKYAPEHLILQIRNAESFVPNYVQNAGSVFVGGLSPESCGDYSSGTNHTLPTYGYARQYSGVNTATFQKFITSQMVTEVGLKNIGKAVMTLAEVEGLEAHRNAIQVRMDKLGLL